MNPPYFLFRKQSIRQLRSANFDHEQVRGFKLTKACMYLPKVQRELLSMGGSAVMKASRVRVRRNKGCKNE